MSGGPSVVAAGSARIDPLGRSTLAKARSSSAATFSVRALTEGAPNTTTTMRRPSRNALATTLNPAAQVKPVFMPSTPG